MVLGGNNPTYQVDRPGGEDRLQELILYVAEKCRDNPRFGATTLNKILFFSDFISYRDHGQPITGAEYQVLKNGPAPRRLLPCRAALHAAGDIDIVKIPTQKKDQVRVVPLRRHNPTMFTDRELRLVDAVIAAVGGFTAETISVASHGAAWRSAAEGEKIAYETAFVSDEPPTEDEKKWALKLSADKHVGPPA